jgi:glycosyltransferase involved in cell wall biosynthesis
MERDRYDADVIVWSFNEEDTYVPLIRNIGVKLHSFPLQRSGIGKLMLLRHLVDILKPEVVHSYSFHTNFAVWYATIGTRSIPIGGVRSDHHWAREDAGPILGALCSRWPRAQIFNNVYAAQTLQLSRSVLAPAKYLVVQNGLDLELFRRMRVEAGGPARILAIGSLYPVKRWDRLLYAAVKLKASALEFEIKIVGGGPLRSSLEQQVRELGIGSRVRFLGHSNDIPSLLSESTILVHTSDFEGCPNAVMEAMAAGLAVIATDAGDIPLLIDDGKTGFVVHRDDEEKLAARLALLIANPALCARIGEAAHEKAKREFGLDKLFKETLAAYKAAGWQEG